MGAYLSEPMTSKRSESGEGNNLTYGACSMQGWRVSQEDSHNCIATYDENSSLFAVYDGHGGAEVAIYLSRHLPEVLKSCDAYKNGEFVKALEDCYLKVDESIKTPEVIKEIQLLAKAANSSQEEAAVDYEEENVGVLYEEATMPLDKLVAKYQAGTTDDCRDDENENADCKPGTSSSSKEPSAGVSPGSSKSLKRNDELISQTSSSSAATSASSRVNGECPKTNSSVRDSTDSSLDQTQTKVAEAHSTTGLEEDVTTKKTEVATSDTSCSSGPAPTNELIIEGKKIEMIKSCEDSNTEEKGEDRESAHVALPEKDVSSSESAEATADISQANTTNKSTTSSTTKVEGVAENGNESEVTTTSNSNSNTTNGDLELSASNTITTVSKVSESESTGITKENQSGTGNNSTGEAGTGTSTPRRKKVIPVPVSVIIEESKPERRSPRKSNSQLPPNKNLDCSDSDESDDEDVGYDMHLGSSDSDEEMDEDEDLEEEESSDEYDEEEEDDDAEEDESFLSDIQEPGYDSGSTAVVCLLKWEDKGLSLWVANAGDSRCVVCREGKAIDMSHDHKPELDAEAQRIVKAGGKVTDDGRVNGGLNLSRALGDHSYKQNPTLPLQEQMISPVPSIEHLVLEPSKDKFLVLACDGIWNSMSSQEVVDFVSVRMEAKEPLSKICEELFDTCLAPDTCGDGTGCDNMTAIIVQLTGVPEVYSGSKRRFQSDDNDEDSTEAMKKSRVEI